MASLIALLKLMLEPFVIVYRAVFGTTQSTEPQPQSRSPLLDVGTHEILTLPNGRDISFNTYGNPSGYPIFYLHGMPGSRLEGSLWHDCATVQGARIISLDRPGMGFSSPHPTRTVLSHAGDVKLLARQLDLKKYSIAGVSGGGPYALACARIHDPDKLKAVALVAAMGPYDMDFKGMMVMNRILFWCCRNFPWLARQMGRLSLSRLQMKRFNDDQTLDMLHKTLKSRFSLMRPPEKDIEVMFNRDVMLMFMQSTRQHFRQGVDPWVEEGRLLGDPSGIGFELGEIRPDLIMRLWHGGQDVNVPLSVAREVYKRLPEGNKELMVVEEQGHISLVVNCRERILKDLLEHSK